jgi:hypothetical protein
MATVPFEMQNIFRNLTALQCGAHVCKISRDVNEKLCDQMNGRRARIAKAKIAQAVWRLTNGQEWPAANAPARGPQAEA